MKLIFILQLVLLFFLVSCTKEKAAPKQVFVPSECDSIPKSFSVDVFPIIQNNCTGCHSGSSPSGGIKLADHNDISSNLILTLETVNHEVGLTPMPYLQPKLSDSLIQVLECWASSGAPNN